MSRGRSRRGRSRLGVCARRCRRARLTTSLPFSSDLSRVPDLHQVRRCSQLVRGATASSSADPSAASPSLHSVLFAGCAHASPCPCASVERVADVASPFLSFSLRHRFPDPFEHDRGQGAQLALTVRESRARRSRPPPFSLPAPRSPSPRGTSAPPAACGVPSRPAPLPSRTTPVSRSAAACSVSQRLFVRPAVRGVPVSATSPSAHLLTARSLARSTSSLPWSHLLPQLHVHQEADGPAHGASSLLPALDALRTPD